MDNILNKADDILASFTERDEILLEVCKLLKEEVQYYDWVGFYLFDQAGNCLKLGPYEGKPTEHTEIPLGKGVCGQVAESKKTMVVQDVSKIGSYIACSLEVQSEIVVPVLKDNVFVAEIDIDSHAYAPFSNQDVMLLESLCKKIASLF
ncbi:MAG: GAF domain-containing protein [Prolixibacteraceae bacterium]|nr:GAF domain-containing protein [Prolixibacteraceae bacterium]